jgi:hypothetical protein
MSRLKKERLSEGRMFIPIIFSFGCVLEDMPFREFLGDPTKVSNALRTIQNYFQVDGVVCYADQMLLAEALGCRPQWSVSPPSIEPLPKMAEEVESLIGTALQEGRLNTAMEVTKRLNALLPDAILMCSISGPLTLARQLAGLGPVEALDHRDLLGQATKAILAFSKALGDVGIDLLLFSEEELPPLDERPLKELRRCYSPIWNTAKFYNISPLLMIERFSMDNLGPLSTILDGLVLPAAASFEKLEQLTRHSFALPVSLLEKEPEEIEAFLSRSAIEVTAKSSSFFLLTTDREVPTTINKEFMIRGVQTVRDYLKKQS